MVSLTPSGPVQLPAGGDLLRHLQASPRPAVIQYHANDTRTELSGRVAVNWAAKTGSLLALHGLDDAAQSVLDLPVHWLSLVASLGISWDCSVTSFPDDDAGGTPNADCAADAELIVTSRPALWANHPGELLALTSVEAGERNEPGEATMTAALPDHAVDFDDEVQGQADQYPAPVPDLVSDTFGAAARLAQAEPQTTAVFERGLVLATGQRRISSQLWAAVREQWSRLSPVILVEASVLDPDRVAHLADTERLG